MNFISVDDPDDRPFCDTAPPRRLLKSETFAKHEEREPHGYFAPFEVLRNEKRWLQKLHPSGRLEQVYIEYTVRKKGSTPRI